MSDELDTDPTWAAVTSWFLRLWDFVWSPVGYLLGYRVSNALSGAALLFLALVWLLILLRVVWWAVCWSWHLTSIALPLPA